MSEPEVTQFTQSNQFVAWSKIKLWDVFVNPDGQVCTVVHISWNCITYIHGTVGNKPTPEQQETWPLFKSEVEEPSYAGDPEPHFLVLWRGHVD